MAPEKMRKGDWAQWIHYKVFELVYGAFTEINIIMEHTVRNYEGLLSLMLTSYSQQEIGR